MNDEKDTYVPYTRDSLIRTIGAEAALLASKLGTYEDEKGAIIVSFAHLANLWGWDVRKVRNAADKLDALQIWHYKKGDGRGHKSEWRKGANYVSFVLTERVQNLQKKGAKNAPNNKEYNKDRLNHAHTRKINQSKKNLSNAGDTPAPPKNEDMEQFEQCWRAFFFGSYAKYEKEQSAYKERAQAVWQYMPENKRTRLLNDLKQGKRYDKTEYFLWYLQHYEIPLQIWYNGDTDLTPAMVSNLQVLKYKGRVAYVKPEDKEAWIKQGARLFNN